MALNFPNPPVADGTVYTDPTTLKQWYYDSSVPGWRSYSKYGPGIVFRGSIDLTKAPNAQDADGKYANIVSGNFFAVEVGADPVDSALYPGLSGTITAPGEIIFDGIEYHLLSASVPNATETNRGVIRIATSEEVTAGTDDETAVTPAKLKSYVDSETGEELPAFDVGNNGEFLTVDNGQLAWQDLPIASNTLNGTIKTAIRADVPTVSDVRNAAYVGHKDRANTPDSIVSLAKELDANTTSVENKIDNHIGAGGTDEHPLATPDVVDGNGDVTTPGVPGFMSSADKHKLDNVQGGVQPAPPIIDDDGIVPVGGILFASFASGYTAKPEFKFGEVMQTGENRYGLWPCDADFNPMFRFGGGFGDSGVYDPPIQYGKWRCLGFSISTQNNSGNVPYPTLWQRIE